MIAVGESTPGPIGVNVATFAGFSTAGILGGVIATFGLVLPSFIIIIFVSKALNKYKDNMYLSGLLADLRPAVVALVVVAGWQIAKLAVYDEKSAVLCAVFTLMIYFVKLSPIIYILAGAAAGIVLKM